MKKGQAATEFLITYGWAIMVVLLVTGAFSYFGFFDVELFIEDSCFFGQNFGECDEFKKELTTISIRLTNNAVHNLTFTYCDVTNYLCAPTSCLIDGNPVTDLVWGSYSQKIVSFSCDEMVNSIDADFKLGFKLPDSAREHVMKGRLIATIE